MVDGELLFFFAQLFPDTLRLGDVLFGELQDVVVVVPEEAELFVADFLCVFFFLVIVVSPCPVIWLYAYPVVYRLSHPGLSRVGFGYSG